MSKKKRELSAEDMKRISEIKITPREQKKLYNMTWEEIIDRAMKFNPNIEPNKKAENESPQSSSE